eukprot:5091922-Lingulodinium_polyedra.AAC.1
MLWHVYCCPATVGSEMLLGRHGCILACWYTIYLLLSHRPNKTPGHPPPITHRNPDPIKITYTLTRKHTIAHTKNYLCCWAALEDRSGQNLHKPSCGMTAAVL